MARILIATKKHKKVNHGLTRMDTDFILATKTLKHEEIYLATEDTESTENSHLCVLGGGNAPNVVCALATHHRPQGLTALL